MSYGIYLLVGIQLPQIDKVCWINDLSQFLNQIKGSRPSMSGE
jgi:hypothetical protein